MRGVADEGEIRGDGQGDGPVALGEIIRDGDDLQRGRCLTGGEGDAGGEYLEMRARNGAAADGDGDEKRKRGVAGAGDGDEPGLQVDFAGGGTGRGDRHSGKAVPGESVGRGGG